MAERPTPGASGGHRADGGGGPAGALEPFLAVVAFLAVSFLVFPGVLAGETFFYGDFHAAFEPLRAALGRALAAGLPLWTDELSHGQPLLASPFAAALYLPNALFALAPGEAGRLLTLLTVAHLAWGATGTFLLARQRGSSRPAASGGAAVFALSGAVLSGSYLSLLCFTASWLPWLLVAAEAAAATPTRPGAVLGLAAVTVLLVTSGDPFVIASALLGVAVTTLPAPGAGSARDAGSPRRTLPVVAGIALGAAAVAPFLVAAARYLRVTTRGAGLPAEAVLERSLHPASALGLLLPDVFGNVFRLGDGGFFAPGLFDGSSPLFPSIYVGLLAVGLALEGAVSAERGALREASWLAVQLLLALGRHLPAYSLLAGLPPFSSSRFPVKWLLPAMLPLALLAARGIDRAAREAREPAGARRAGIRGLALLALPLALALGTLLGGGRALARRLPAAGSPPPASGDPARSLERHVLAGAARTALPVAGAVLLAALAARRRRTGFVAPGLALLVAADLASSGREHARTVAAGFFAQRPAVVDLLLADGAYRVWVDGSPEARSVELRVPAASNALEDVVRLRREVLDGLSGASYGLRLAFPADLERLVPVPAEQLQRLVETLPSRERAALLRACSVSHALSPVDRSGDGVVPIGAAPGLLAAWRVYRVARPLPEVRVVAELRAHDGPDGLARLLSTSPDDIVDRVAFVDRQVLPGSKERVFPPGARPGSEASWRLGNVRRTAARLEVEVSGPAGFLVVSGTWAPGWRARVDGRQAPVLPVNLAFRGVPFPPGTHVVEMSYSPF